MSATIEQIALEAGVSRGTVDRVLHNRGRVSPDVTDRVWQAVDKLEYSIKRRNRRQQQASLPLGVVTQLGKASFMREVNRGIRRAGEEMRLRGITLLQKESQDVNEEEQLGAIDELVAQGIQGLAIMPMDSNRVRLRLRELVEDHDIPVVTFNSDIAGAGRSCFVGLDNKKSGALAAGLMGMLTGGHGKVLIVTGYFSNNVNNMRVDGFVAETRKSYPGLEVLGVQGSFDDCNEVEAIITKTLDTHPDLAGILVVSGGQAGIPRALSGAALPRKPHVIIYDLLSKTKQLLLDGTADFLIDQESYVQGYQALHVLADMVQSGVPPKQERQYTNINIRTKYNV